MSPIVDSLRHLTPNEVSVVFESTDVPIHIEQWRVIVGCACKVDSQWGKQNCRNPHSKQRTPRALLGELLARDRDDIVDDKEYHRDYDWHTQTTSADDGSEWCADEEEYKNRYRQG